MAFGKSVLRLSALRLSLAALFAASVLPNHAQEAYRVSLAGQEAAEARRRAMEQPQNSLLKLGPVSLRVSTSMSVEATDNVKATESDAEADMAFRPQVDTFGVWRISDQNALTFGLGIGYLKYIRTTEYDTLFISPGSDLSFDLYIDDFAINFHDRFNYTADVSTDPTVSGTGSLNRFENILGMRVLWDLNKAIVSAGYDHATYIAADSVNDYLNHSEELFTASAGFQINPVVFGGLDLGAGLTDYDQNQLQDNQHFSIGPHVKAQLTDYTSLRASGGYVIYSLDTTGQTNAVDETSAFYFDVALRQRLNSMWTHSLNFGHRLQAGIQLDVIDLWYVYYSASVALFRYTSLSPSLSYEHATQPGDQTEEMDRVGFGLSLERPIARDTIASLSYQFYYKSSNLPERSYLQNRLVFRVGYTF